jgi:MFS family permease
MGAAMTTAAEALARPAGAPAVPVGIPFRLILLLTAAMFINYADRGSLSLAAPLLKDRFGLSNAQMGLLLSAFFWSYAAAQPLAGAIAQRFSVRTVLAVGLAVWAGATAACGLAAGFVSLLGLRLLVGLGESVIFPANARILSEHAPDHQRGRANGIISLGMFLGPTAGTFLGGLILAQFDWRAVFFALGGVSLLWLIPWLATPLGAIAQRGAAVAVPPGFAAILRQRGLWGAALGQFGYAYNHYLLLTWLPFYLVKAQHFSLASMAGVGAAIYAVQAAGSFASGWLSDLAIRAGGASSNVRKAFILTGVAGAAVSMVAASIAPHAFVMPSLFAAALCNGVTSPIVFTIGQTLAGPRAGARWMGVQNTFGQVAGILAPIVTGVMVDATGSFATAFLVAAGLSMVGILCWAFVVPRIEPVAWPAEPA